MRCTVLALVGSGLFVGCGSDTKEDLACGPGTIEIEDVCRPQGEGTVITCGPGTVEQDGQCLPVGPAGPTCGDGTHEEEGECVPDGGGVTCGTGTHEEGGLCVPDENGGGLTCGPGTVERDGECVPTASWFQMRSTVSEVVADGISRIPVFLIGQAEDGTPATDLVVLAVGRANAGQFLQNTAELLPTGSTVYYRPCNASSNPFCAGPVELQMFLAGDLENPVATLELELVNSAGVYSPASCLVGGNAMFFDGNGWVWTGTLFVTDGAWSAQAASDKFVHVHLEPTGQENGLWWDFEFSALMMDVPLMPGIYEMAERYPFESPNRPGMDVTGDGRGCNMIAGRYQVHEYERAGASIHSLTVSFEQHCDGAGNVLFGCVHFEE
jgi:hypothetical protein